jgi:hypothetical protein
MERIVQDDLAAAVAFGRKRLRANEMDANDAVLVYDGRMPLGDEKVDAIFLEIRAEFSPKSEAMLAVPYTPKQTGQFRVHKPKLLEWKNCEDFDMDVALQVFFDGVHAHEIGSKIWNDCLDESR